jgi:hypothetical protein
VQHLIDLPFQGRVGLSAVDQHFPFIRPMKQHCRYASDAEPLGVALILDHLLGVAAAG